MSLLKRTNSRRFAMSIEKNEQSPNQTKQEQNLSIIRHKSGLLKFHGVFEASPDAADKSLLWKLTLPIPVGIKKQYVTLKDTTYIISNWTEDQFPNVFYLGLDTALGYRNQQGQLTTRIAALQLQRIQTVLDQSDVRTYELIYKITDCITWQVLPTMAQFKFRLYSDLNTTPIELPLPNPMTLSLQVRRQ